MCDKYRLKLDKKQLLALRWACDYYIVTEENLMKRFEFMVKINAV